MMDKITIENNDGSKTVFELEKKLLYKERLEKRRRRRLCFSIVALIFLIFSLGYLFGYHRSRNFIFNQELRNGQLETQDQISQLIDRFWLYKDQHPNLYKELRLKALKGMTTFENDPYTTYFSLDQQKAFLNNLNLNFVGIGILMEEDAQKYPRVLEVYEETPAYEQGLRFGDLIVSIDNQDLKGLGIAKLKEVVKNSTTKVIKLNIVRNKENLTIEIPLKPLDLSVHGKAFNDFYFIKINTFGQTVAQKVENHLLKMKNLNLDTVMIDLRGNGGGFLKSASELLGLFLKEKSITLKEVRNNNQETIVYVKGRYHDFVKKVIILQNKESASASEVFILAMREQHPNTVTVGEKTFGKGVIQEEFSLIDHGALKLTTAKWLSSKGVWVEKQGIEPDHMVLQPFIQANNLIPLAEKESYSVGSKHDIIPAIRELLVFLGYDLKSDLLSTHFDERLFETIKQFEKENNYEVKGVIDLKLQKHLVSKIKELQLRQPEKYDPVYQKALSLIHG